MTDKTIKDILADIVCLDSNLVALHDHYIEEREQAVAPIRDKYNSQKRKLERKRAELHSLLSINMMEVIHNPKEPQPKIDENMYGYSSTDTVAETLKKVSILGDI